MAGVARRVLDGPAALARLELEAPFGGGRGHAERGAAARERRQVHLPRAQDRVLPARLHQRHRHGAALARIDRAGAQAAVVGDHAEAGDEAELRLLDRALAGIVGELADRLGHAEEAAGAAGLPGRELAAAGVVREVAVVRQGARANEGRPLALGAKAQVLELQHHDDRVVVVGLDEVDRLGPDAGLRVEVVAVDAPAAAQQHRVVGEGVVALDRAAHEHVGEAEVAARASLITRKASAPAHGMTQSNRWIGSAIGRAARYCSSVSGVLNSAPGFFSALARWATAMRPKSSRVAPYFAHVGGGDEREDRVRPARAVRIARVAREVREAAEHLPERLDVVGIGGDAGDDVGVSRLHRARGAAQRHHARRAAGRDVVEPARAEAEVLGDADGGVGREREAADGEAVDLFLGDPRSLDQRIDRPADEPVRAVRRVADVRHGHRHRDGDALVGTARAGARSRHRFAAPLHGARVDAVRRARELRASSRSSLRWIFCDTVSGNASTKAT